MSAIDDVKTYTQKTGVFEALLRNAVLELDARLAGVESTLPEHASRIGVAKLSADLATAGNRQQDTALEEHAAALEDHAEKIAALEVTGGGTRPQIVDGRELVGAIVDAVLAVLAERVGTAGSSLISI